MYQKAFLVLIRFLPMVKYGDEIVQEVTIFYMALKRGEEENIQREQNWRTGNQYEKKK